MREVISRELLCGITYQDVMNCAGMNQRQAAERLGVSRRHLGEVLRRIGATHWLSDVRPRPRCVSREDIIKVASEGYTRNDAAFILGISPEYLRDLVEKWGVQDAFTVRKGKAAWVARRGYAN